jgi:sec-independent protein translocase protein TatA
MAMNLYPVAFLQNLGMTEILLILAVLLLLFGGKKLPELARGLGRSIKEFRKGQQDETGSDESGKPSGESK